MSSPSTQTLIDWAIQNLQKYYIKIAPSTVEGVGLFAIRDIPKGTVVMTFSYRDFPCIEIPKSTLKSKLPKEVYSRLISNWAETEDAVMAPLNINQQLHYVNFLNHSNEANIQYSNERYISLRKILKGEELFINFKENEYNPHGVRFKDRP